MSVTFSHVRVGEAVRHEALSVFPLFLDSPGGAGQAPADYALADDAVQSGAVKVEEISEGGSVPDLAVENTGDQRVLFLEGEELVGAKQNRILNLSLLIAAHSKSKIPVSCVEAGRWHYKSSAFSHSGSHSPYKLRYFLKKSVSSSAKATGAYRSDQGQIWNEVSRKQAAMGASSGTAAMADTFKAYEKRLQNFHDKMNYIDGAVGAAVAIGGKVVMIDLFDKQATCRSVWNRLLSGVALDALEAGEVNEKAEKADVEKLLGDWDNLPWETSNAVGDGEQQRAETPTGDHGSALLLDGVLIHGSVVCE